jgi:hypothetical protein
VFTQSFIALSIYSLSSLLCCNQPASFLTKNGVWAPRLLGAAQAPSHENLCYFLIIWYTAAVSWDFNSCGIPAGLTIRAAQARSSARLSFLLLFAGLYAQSNALYHRHGLRSPSLQSISPIAWNLKEHIDSLCSPCPKYPWLRNQSIKRPNRLAPRILPSVDTPRLRCVRTPTGLYWPANGPILASSYSNQILDVNIFFLSKVCFSA